MTGINSKVIASPTVVKTLHDRKSNHPDGSHILQTGAHSNELTGNSIPV